MKQYYIGIDMGGTKCAVVLGDADGVILQRLAFPSGKNAHPETYMPKFYEAIDTLCEAHQNGLPPLAIGVSCGGPLDSCKGVIQAPPNLPLWNDVPICDLLQTRYGCPTYLQNDANACAIAEWQFGAGKGTRNMIFLTFGTGLGAGLILDGKLYEGTNGMAGEAGHIRLAAQGPVGYGKSGSFEGFCSGSGLRQMGETSLNALHTQGKAAAFWPKTRATHE
ncbi:MAG: ROK family protein, partial [Ruthenibacterium sp.]